MHILIGSRCKMKEELWAGDDVCTKCKQNSHFHLSKMIKKLTVFYIPIISVTQGYYCTCDSCKDAKKLRRSVYRKRYKMQFACLENGGFPQDMVLRDCGKRSTKRIRTWINFFLSALCFTFFLLCAMLFSNNVIIGGMMLVLFAAPCAFWFYTALNRLITTARKRRVFIETKDGISV